MLFTSPGGRKKLSLALGVPLLLTAVVLMFLPADETPNAQTSPASPPKVQTESPKAPLPETDASQIADLIPDVPENGLLSEPPPPSVPSEPDPAAVAVVPDEPETSDPVVPVPTPIDPEHGLVQAIPADSPVAQPPVETPATPVGTDDPAITVHTVVKGDTLTKISNSYRVSISEIRQANQLKNDTVQVGQQLRIPGAAPQRPVQPTQPTQPPVTESSRPAATRHHTVVRGDTLTRIARKYAVDPKAIMRANGMKTDVVRLGAKLVIPPAGP